MKNIISESVEIIRPIENEGIESEIKHLESEIKELFSSTVSKIHSVLKGFEIEGEETKEALKTFFLDLAYFRRLSVIASLQKGGEL